MANLHVGSILLGAKIGSKNSLAENARRTLWSLFESVREELSSRKLITEAEACQRLQGRFSELGQFPYSFAIIDEAQDITVPQLRLLASALATKHNGLFFAGDLGQRIFQQPFSWIKLGVDIRGRSKTLRINYRTSQEIRRHADRLLDTQFTDADGETQDRSGVVSVFSGPVPVVIRSRNESEECEQVAHWVQELISNGIRVRDICIIVRSADEYQRAFDVATIIGCKTKRLNASNFDHDDAISIATMHLVKGLEYRVVVVMACDDEVVPLQSRIESVGDDADLQEVYATERQLLYVACTRARDYLLVSGVCPVSEFLDDFEEQ